MTFTRFTRKHDNTVLNQVCPNGNFRIVQEQLENSDIQRMTRIFSQNERHLIMLALEASFSKKLEKNETRLERGNNDSYRNFFDGTGISKCKQIVFPPETIRQIVQSLHNDPLQGRPGSSNVVHKHRKKYYSPNLAELVLQYVANCRDCFRSKPIRKIASTPPLQQIYADLRPL